MSPAAKARLLDPEWNDVTMVVQFARRWDNYVLLLTLVVTCSMIFQIQLMAENPHQKYPLYPSGYAEKIAVDKYVRQEMAALRTIPWDKEEGSDDVMFTRRTLSPFERLLRKRKSRDKPLIVDDDADSEDIDDDELPACAIPSYTKFTKCRIEIVARPAPADDVLEEEVMDGPWRGYFTVDGKQVYKWKTPPSFVVFGIRRDCVVEEMADFSNPEQRPGGFANFSQYYDILSNKTVLAGIAYGKSPSLLGLTVFGIERWYLSKQANNGILAFVGWKGFPGHTRYIMDNSGNSSVTIKTYFHFGHDFNYTLEEISYPTALLRHPEMITAGGFWRPKHCTPRSTVALIIPYRKREKHLAVFVDNMIRFLQLQLIAFQIFIIDQAEPDLFNRAALMNIGYLEAKKFRSFDCYHFHDVDLIPEDLTNSYECTSHPRHLVVTRSVTGYRLRFEFYFGGAISMKPEHIEKINGFPNRVFGWGGEDDEIFARVNYTQLNVMRYPLEIGRYVSLPHGEDKGNPHVPRLADHILSNVSDVIYEDGLNSMNYAVIGMEKRRLFTQVLVRIPGPTRMEDLPDFIAWSKEQEELAAAEEAKNLAEGIVADRVGKVKAKHPR